MSGSLFRQEALDARRNQWLGGISLVQPLRWWILAGFVAFAALALLLFLFLGGYTRRSTVSGQLVPSAGLVTVMASSTGVIARLPVDEGDRVDHGQALAVVAVPRALASGEDAAAVLGQALTRKQDSHLREARSRDELMATQAEGLERQLKIARRELAGIEQEAATRAEQARLAQEILERYRSLSAERYVSELQMRQQEQAALEQIAAEQSLARQSNAVRRAIAQLEQALAELPAQREAQGAVADRELASLTQERVQTEAGAELLLKAPSAGLVASRSVETGQAVQAGQPLLSLLPEGSGLEAQLLVPSRAIGFIAPGDTVLLRYQAFPHQKFGHHRGTVKRISRSALTPLEIGALVGGNQTSEPFYRVRVELQSQSIMAFGNPEPLRPGMLVEADILGERRKLSEWVLEPLYSVRGMAAGD